ncbi:Gfo/Idh/MocA family protein [Jeotgalibaca sp. A127]|uniref:Gfo/Idh/MocA family protein n=1 Tax=Jeotgalibaca sp. A127 TaxID=3457324 RepID=UPI003FD0DE69
MKWAILGAGNIANDFARSFKTDKAELYAVASRSKEKAAAFADQYKIPVSYGSYEEMLADATIDAVYIATPHSHHYKQIKQCLNAGKHVFSEKVMVTSGVQLDEVIQLAADKNLYLAEAMTIFHVPLYPKLKQWIAEHDLGKLKYIHAPYGAFKPEDSPMYFYKPELAGGALFDIGTYALTFALEFMTSQPDEILTFGNLHETGVDETSVILLKNKEKELATITLSFGTDLPHVGVVAFQKGYLEIPGYTRANQATFTDLQGNKTVIETTDTAHAFTHEINNFTNMVLEKGANPTLAKTKNVMTIMDTVRAEWGLVYPFD